MPPAASTLAMLGGEKHIRWQAPAYNPIGQEEAVAVNEVMQSGVLSGFVGASGEKFLGGPKVQDFEAAIAKYYGSRYAISVNSLTSGLICAVGALDVEPGDEIIVSPWTMCASATAIVFWGAIPIFADIELDTFNIDPVAIAAKITPRTKAIMVPSIFGLPAKLEAIVELAHEHGLRVIEDAAQAPGVKLNDKFVGTFGDIGGFSFNYHKHIHCGEGGVCITDSEYLAQRMRLIRNHAEAVVEDKGVTSLGNMVGFNFRLGELEAAIAEQQMHKLDGYVAQRWQQGVKLNRLLGKLPGLHPPALEPDQMHAFYMYGMRIDAEGLQSAGLAVNDFGSLGKIRDLLCEALRGEGVPGVCSRYVNVHMLPMYQKKIAFGTRGYPWQAHENGRAVDYTRGICPQAEVLNEQSYIGLSLCEYAFDDVHIDDIAAAFKKVWKSLDQLRPKP
ncbi:MAG: pyridoxal-5'-phosphate-dependent protein [Alteromonadaceae bacterium]|nr:MAG: pyridoxal-5'-phosphate-dependent protein [Alteromonadaceae bacterium]